VPARPSGGDLTVVSARQLNRALLARQLLLERSRMSVPRALERIAGMQAQYAPSMYIGLWSRLAGFERSALTRALQRRTVVQGTLMRATIHLVSARDYWPFAVGIREERREWWLRVHRHQPGAAAHVAAAQRLRRRLAAGPLRRREIQELLGEEAAQGVGLWLDLVRVPPSGTWEQRRADLYGAAADWLGRRGEVTPDGGLDHLVMRYLGGFGPAPVNDIADWAGVGVRTVAPALERMHLRRFIGEDGRELLDLPRAALPDPATPAPVRLLPTWDATLLVHARRTAIVPEAYRPLLFNTKTPQSVATFLVDGSVAGTWRIERTRDRATLTLDHFEPLPRRVERELAAEAEAMVRWAEGDATSFAVRF
jgi:winged helix DNA-binding protein